MTIDPEQDKSVPEKSKAEKKEILFHGIPCSPGIAMGKVFLFGGNESDTDVHNTTESNEIRIDDEVSAYQTALNKTRNDIRELQEKVQSSVEKREASIFDAHLLIAEDRMMSSEVIAMIREKHISAKDAFSAVIQKYISAISNMGDSYLKERADDIRDVADRILDNLSGIDKSHLLDSLPDNSILVAHNLTPSDTVTMDREHIRGFAIETGSKTSHTAILARALRLPAIVGLQHITARFESGDSVIIDGYLGMVILNPEPETVDFYKEKAARRDELNKELLKESTLLAETTDGYRMKLCANVESAKEAEDMHQYGAEGTGLFRTEFMYMKAKELPSEDRQYEEYLKVAKASHGRNTVIRTIDIGGDKLDDSVSAVREPNPFLGLRAIRLAHENPELIMTQLRALLRAGAESNISILFPMVSSCEEFDQLEKMVQEAKKQLEQRHVPFDRNIKLGVMIEIPSAAILAEKLAERVDFFSIGTNDLVQYTLAVDRMNERVAHLYSPSNPAILELISRTVKAALNHNIYVCICGELAADPMFTPIFLGLGVQELSMSPASIGAIRRVIRKISMREAEQIANEALKASSADDALRAAKEFLKTAVPDVIAISE